ncbi:MAG: hypothetical protein LBI13_10975 [Streptococcaceae bacterium]|jgi:hypothetical protein|nr:hypothetical protein [Streptococcaceae bacterium]
MNLNLSVLDQLKAGDLTRFPVEYRDFLLRKISEFYANGWHVWELRQIEDKNLRDHYAHVISQITKIREYRILPKTPGDILVKETMIIVTDKNRDLIAFCGRGRVEMSSRPALPVILTARNSEIGTLYTSDSKGETGDYKYRNHGLAKFLTALLVGYAQADGADAVFFANENSIRVAEFLNFQEITESENLKTHQIADPLLELCLTDCQHYHDRPKESICCDKIMIKKVGN